MSRARVLADRANQNTLAVDTTNSEVGIASTVPNATLDVRGEVKVGTAVQLGVAGVVTATSFSGSGSNLTGLATTETVRTDTITVAGVSTLTGVTNVTGVANFASAINADATTDSTSVSTGALIVDGGVGIAKNVYIGAGLSVAGTLTYEDVTNVDSVGLITAKSGVNVSGGQLQVGVAYSVGAAGVCTAAGFVGPLTGAVTGTASNATNVTVADESSDATCFPVFVTAATGDLPPKTGDNLTFNSATGILAAGGVTADVTGNLTGTASNASGATGDFSIADKIIHTGDTDTAIRFPAVNTVSVETANDERVRVDSSGRVGIGTAPAEEVHILAATPTLLVEGTNTGTGAIVADVDVRAQYYRKAGYSISDSNATEDIFIGRPYGSGDTTAPLVFDFQGEEKVRFRHDGLVGFGTNNPSFEMEIRKTGQVDLLIGSYDANGARLMFDGDSNGDGSGSDFSEIMHDTSGDLTINARDPASDSNLIIKTGGGTERLRITSGGGFLFSNGELVERCNITAGKLSDNTNIDLEDGMVHYFTTQESTTSTPNIRVSSSTTLNSVMDAGDVVTVTLVTTAAAGGYSANVTIDGNAVTEEWVGGSAPSAGGSDGLDIYVYTIICTHASNTGDSGFKVIANYVNATN